MKDAAKGRSLAVLVAMRSHVSLDRNAPPTCNFRALVVYGDQMRAHTVLCKLLAKVKCMLRTQY